MNQKEQIWLVLLYSLMELGGQATKGNVLQHIQNNGYWDKNDYNDNTLPSRKEMRWRNTFAFEREHLKKGRRTLFHLGKAHTA